MRKRTNKLPIAILDWDMCLRVHPGDEREASKGHAYQCMDCKKAGTYSGKLGFDYDEENVPYCREHDPAVAMELVCDC